MEDDAAFVLEADVMPTSCQLSTLDLECLQVVGFDDPIKISKRVQYERVNSRAARASRADIKRPILDSELQPLCSSAAQAGGIEFEAHIPLSQAAHVQLHALE
jgi:hypothetical protein